MNEYIFTRLAGDEAKSLAGVEPLNCSLFFHCVFSLLIFELFGASRTAPNGKKKRDRKCELAAPSKASKGFTRATNARPVYHKRDYSRAQSRSAQSVSLRLSAAVGTFTSLRYDELEEWYPRVVTRRRGKMLRTKGVPPAQVQSYPAPGSRATVLPWIPFSSPKESGSLLATIP